MSLRPGSRLGPYEISGSIGAGGMGEVYRARDTRLGREVAIKVLPADLAADPERLARFEREARSSSSLNHRNIVTIHDFASHEGQACLVMELVRGELLRDVIAQGPVPLKRLLPVAAGIAEGLAAAHAAGLIHRDLKPENIVVADDDTPKILDFGLAKSASSADAPDSPTDVQVTRAGTVVGTAGYMAPEQARGGTVDFRADQFSFGVILVEMATGTHPFRRATAVDTLAAILHDDPPPLPGSLPEPLVWIVERCLAKDPAQRYGSTADLAYELRRLRDRPRSSLAVPAAKSRLRVWPGIAAVALAVALVVVVVRNSRGSRAPAPLEISLAVPQIEQVTLTEIVLPLAISPDGRYVAIAGSGSDGVDRLWLRDLRSRTVQTIADSEHPYGVAWSSDSRSIVYCSAGKLKIVSVDGGPPRVICDASPPGMPTWSGDTILFAVPAGIFAVNAEGGTPRLILPPDPAHPADVLMWPQFLPDGKHFLYLASNRKNGEIEHELLAGSLDRGAPRRLAAIDSRALFANDRLLFVRDGVLLAQPFNPEKLQFTGEPKPLVDSVYDFRSTGLAAFSVSNTGLLVWSDPRRPSREVWLDRHGLEIGTLGSAVFVGGRLSPDGTRYAASLIDPKQGTSDIWIYNLALQNAERLTFHNTEESDPVWSRDGRTIFYRCDVFGPPDIFRWNLGQDHGTLLFQGPGVEQPEDVSPDGRTLLFVSYNRTVGSRIFVLPLNPPGPPRPFIAAPFNELEPRFSPDGRWVAYESDVSGRPEIYVRAFEGSAFSTRISRDGGTHPRWSSRGGELFFLGLGGQLMSASVKGDATAGVPRVIFKVSDALDFEPAPDGSRFLVQLREHAARPQIGLLVNWPERLSGQSFAR